MKKKIKKHKINFGLKSELSYLTGYWLGDGSRCKSFNAFEVCINSKEKQTIEKISKLIKKISGYRPKLHTPIYENCTYITLHSIELKRWLNQKLSTGKIWQEVYGYEKEFLTGFLDSDGAILIPDKKQYEGKVITIEFYNTELDWLKQIQNILNDLRLHSIIRETGSQEDYYGNFKKDAKPQYTLTIQQRSSVYILSKLLFPFLSKPYHIKRVKNFIKYWDRLKLSSKIPIEEIFHSFQGEGTLIGKPQIFIRASGCPFACVGCDTKYSWKVKKQLTLKEIITKVKKYNCQSICLTGGEITLYPNNTAALIAFLRSEGYFVSIQTNGWKWTQPLNIVNKVCMDMKPSSINAKGLKQKSDVTLIEKLNPKFDEVKVLVRDEKDIIFAKKINNLTYKNNIINIIQIYNEVGKNTNNDLIERYKWLVERIIKDKDFHGDIRILPQLHVWLFGNKKGI